ncbi:hypothetical protein BJI67_04490 [Acidihalobacter aeolianus]|uniref:histidine kinase n=1 Tax=Acidihalobacter aeolianus TaxID=2792603 RepID=A0A1D8K650_9GAMM|nr:ATP-binding protein [Acidihalobacter aeolianus]AOV16426.1 hypothetical protein BJI67_04490 [Acidihalobacter aeolianus]
MRSLRLRLLLAAGAVLAAFVVLTGVALDRAFSAAAIHAQEAKLRGLTYALLGAADIDARSVRVSLPQLGDPRLQQPGSGLYALIADARGHVVWASPSLLAPPAEVPPPAIGAWRFARERGAASDRFVSAFGVRWTPDSGGHRYTFVVAEQAAAYVAQLSEFRRTLAFWLSVAAVLLLLALAGVLRWGLTPLRALSGELHRVERGEVEQIGGRYPTELAPLVSGLNALLTHERSRQGRYRHALDDLAHSLKTPLAVLRGLGVRDGLTGEAERRVAEQVGRMDQIVAYHLNRASAGPVHGLMPPLALASPVARVVAAVERAYRDRGLSFETDLPAGVTGRVEENDLMELAGNLVDNAAKWAQNRIFVRLARTVGGIELTVEDDGPGFGDDNAERLLARGVRADQQVEGQGIGLAVVVDLAHTYGGEVRIAPSRWGGAAVGVTLPNA